VLTHFDWTLHPLRWSLPAETDDAKANAVVAAWPTGRWFTRDDALAAGLPAPLRKLLLS
jgi:A/G-specific adenine glycosylase